MGIVAGWARRFDTKRAESLGFQAEKSFDEIIRVHIDDELGGNLREVVVRGGARFNGLRAKASRAPASSALCR